jgi:catechol 2,3-dioxygenase-like lactoylglutathione lyase family enzyme
MRVLGFFSLVAVLIAGHLIDVSATKKQPQRPLILGIAQVSIFATDLPKTHRFYYKLLPPRPWDTFLYCNWCEQVPGPNLFINGFQTVQLISAPSRTPLDLISGITFATSDLEVLRQYLKSQKVAIGKPAKTGDNSLSVFDPEGHRITFAQWPATLPKLAEKYPPNMRLIEAGFVVHNREHADHFYKDILGFRVCSPVAGGDSLTESARLQVPDGIGTIEYRLDGSSDSAGSQPRKSSYVTLTTTSIESKVDQLRDDRLVSILEEAQTGPDGKRQLDLFDPNGLLIHIKESTATPKSYTSQFDAGPPNP